MEELCLAFRVSGHFSKCDSRFETFLTLETPNFNETVVKPVFLKAQEVVCGATFKKNWYSLDFIKFQFVAELEYLRPKKKKRKVCLKKSLLLFGVFASQTSLFWSCHFLQLNFVDISGDLKKKKRTEVQQHKEFTSLNTNQTVRA